MNNRKTPVWLIVVVIVLLGAVAIINGRTRPADEEGAPPQEASNNLQATPITQGEKEKDKKDLQSGLPSPSKPGATPSSAPNVMTPAPPKMKGMPETSITNPKSQKYHPKPDDAMTSGQWWTDGSLRKKQADEDAKSR